MTELEQAFIDEMAERQITRAMLHTNIAVTMFNAGIKDNVIPPSATAVVNLRPMPRDTPEVIIEHVKKAIDDDRITMRDISASTPATAVADPEGEGYKLVEKTIRQTWGNDLIVSPFFVIGGSDAKHFLARPFAPDVYTFTGIQLESLAEFAGFWDLDPEALIRRDEASARIILANHEFLATVQENLRSAGLPD
jgi:carboxypeptidase PM20D1